MEHKTVDLKIKDLNVNSKNINALVKVLEVGEPKDIPSRFGDKKVSEVKVGDETGCILMSLWNDQIGKVNVGDVISIENGYISVVRNSMRLNIGKYGKMLISEEELKDVNEEVNISDQHVEGAQKRGFGGGRRRY
ncbi:MAG: single-stranded DNA-binding protein [Methanosarcinales archaeon]|nr:MAG: single-stranded DNA-binding protein [Methanosarcinales archaeon]